MPDEHVGFGPAALENPETDKFATKEEVVAESLPSIPEQEPAQPEEGKKYEKLLSSVAQATSVVTDEEAKTDVIQVQGFEKEEEKIEHLVKLAETKGLPHAVRVASNLKDYYALDKFHDELVDSFYDALVTKGLITKE